jgi:hypothetical protein
MAINNRQDFIDYCRRALGEPVIELNIADEQIEDRVDEALKKFWDFHCDGSEQNYKIYRITALDLQRRYLVMDDKTLTVTKLFPQNSYSSSYNPQQLSVIQSVADNLSMSGGVSSYLIQQEYLSTLNQFFNREKMIQYNRYTRRVKINADWNEFKEGDYFLLECQDKIDPEEFEEVWNNGWLQKYCTALCGILWGRNLLKYDGFQLPSGMTLSGSAILEEYSAMKEALDEELLSTWIAPCAMIIG